MTAHTAARATVDLAKTTAPRADWKPPRARRVRAIRDRLRTVYGIPAATPHRRPIEELILTVLSQSTNDRNRDVAWTRLRERFSSWDEVRDAPVEEVEEAIRPGGISRVKSARIQAILRAIEAAADDPESELLPASARDHDDPLELRWLGDVPVEQAQAYLCSLPGVGRKTTACVLLFSFGARDVPVDTHVGRVATRLGLLRPGAGADEQHDEMVALTPPGEELELHMNLIRHGRRTCHAQRPRCDECVLRRLCPSRDFAQA